MPYAPDIRKDFIVKDAVYTSGADGAASNTINIGFKPTFVHSYITNSTNGGYLFGEPTGLKLYDPDADALVSDDANALTSITANGFVHGTSSKLTTVSQQTIFNCWKGSGNTGAVNSTGSITANVSSNSSVGFSFTKYTGTGSAGATIPHGLGKKPEVIWFKCLSAAQGQGAIVVEVPNRDHMNFANGDIMRVTQQGAKFQDTNVLNSTSPTKTLITLGNSTRSNGSGATYAAIAWRSIKGVCKIGFYNASGTADRNMNTFVYTGFKPSLIYVKNTASGVWRVYNLHYHNSNTDTTARRFTNPKGQEVGWGGGTSDGRDQEIYIFSNGFRLGGQGSGMGDAFKNYLYMAFAHESLVSTNNIPTTGV